MHAGCLPAFHRSRLTQAPGAHLDGLPACLLSGAGGLLDRSAGGTGGARGALHRRSGGVLGSAHGAACSAVGCVARARPNAA